LKTHTKEIEKNSEKKVLQLIFDLFHIFTEIRALKGYKMLLK